MKIFWLTESKRIDTIVYGNKQAKIYEMNNFFAYNITRDSESFKDLKCLCNIRVLSTFLTGGKRTHSWSEVCFNWFFISVSWILSLGWSFVDYQTDFYQPRIPRTGKEFAQKRIAPGKSTASIWNDYIRKVYISFVQCLLRIIFTSFGAHPERKLLWTFNQHYFKDCKWTNVHVSHTEFFV